METKDYLRMLREEIHSTVFATVDEQGLPAARVIDIMLTDEDSLYFITARGKAFYRQLARTPFVAISGMAGGEGSMNKRAVSVRGAVEELGSGLIPRVFEENPYMAQIYPTEVSREALTVFRLYEGEGEYFDLSTKPVTRHIFHIGRSGAGNTAEGNTAEGNTAEGNTVEGSNVKGSTMKGSTAAENASENAGAAGEYRITERCDGCGNCLEKCPQNCIETDRIPFMIQAEHCLHCGNCLRVCHAGAVVRL